MEGILADIGTSHWKWLIIILHFSNLHKQDWCPKNNLNFFFFPEKWLKNNAKNWLKIYFDTRWGTHSRSHFFEKYVFLKIFSHLLLVKVFWKFHFFHQSDLRTTFTETFYGFKYTVFWTQIVVYLRRLTTFNLKFNIFLKWTASHYKIFLALFHDFEAFHMKFTHFCSFLQS